MTDSGFYLTGKVGLTTETKAWDTLVGVVVHEDVADGENCFLVLVWLRTYVVQGG